jgi:hypothetical protein
MSEIQAHFRKLPMESVNQFCNREAAKIITVSNITPPFELVLCTLRPKPKTAFSTLRHTSSIRTTFSCKTPSKKSVSFFPSINWLIERNRKGCEGIINCDYLQLLENDDGFCSSFDALGNPVVRNRAWADYLLYQLFNFILHVQANRRHDWGWPWLLWYCAQVLR